MAPMTVLQKNVLLNKSKSFISELYFSHEWSRGEEKKIADFKLLLFFFTAVSDFVPGLKGKKDLNFVHGK
jgi:hypothetical protein